MMNSGGGKGARIVLKGIKRNVEKRRVYNGSEVLIDALNPVEDVVCETYWITMIMSRLVEEKVENPKLSSHLSSHRLIAK